MFATLIPNAPDLMVLAGVSPENNNRVIISVISPKSQQVQVHYDTFPVDFREDYCRTCPNYYYSYNVDRAKDLFVSDIDRESYIDWDEYREALREAADRIDRSDYESDQAYEEAVTQAQGEISEEDFIDEDSYQSDLGREYSDWFDDYFCSGGPDMIHDHACRHYTLEEVSSSGTTWHKTIPHVYQYSVTFLNYETEAHKKWEVRDYLFAIDDSTEQTERDIKIQIAPYEVGNVFDTGSICWGNNSLTHNMRYQYALFWNSTFNNDLVPSEYDIADWLSEFHLYKDDLEWMSVEATLFFGCEGISNDSETERPIEGILIIPSQDSSSKAQLAWVFKDDEGYFAYTAEGDPTSRISLELNGLFLSLK